MIIGSAEYLSKTEKAADGCLLWKGCRNKDGYGRVWHGGRVHNLHRLIWGLLHGEIPDRWVIRHKCDQPNCINPDHLEAGTAGDNARDKAVRLRAPGKLAPEDVLSVRRARGTCRSIGAAFGVSAATVSLIKNGRRRNHVR